jgi:putative two-component system response regulator
LKLGKCITRHHHEKWDGTGYPDGLKGENIPLSARIMAIADTYDALRSDRVYKEAYSHEKSLKIIKQGAGSHFDPEIVDVFMEYEREIKALYS